MKKVIKALCITVGALVITGGIIVGGSYLAVKAMFGIDEFKAISCLKKVSKNVDESEIITSKYTSADLDSAVSKLNGTTPNILVKNGDHYKINTTTSLPLMLHDVSLTGKETTALINDLNTETIENVTLLDISYTNLSDSSADLVTTIKYDCSSFKSNLTTFPLSLVNKYIPDNIYIRSNVKVTKETEAFKYTTTSNELLINNLSKEDSEYTVLLLNKFAGFKEYDELNLSMGQTITNVLIGDSSSKGIAYVYSDLGAKDFKFTTENNEVCFNIYK